MKTFIYKVFDFSENYITTWLDVTSEPSFSQEINTAGSSMTITLARSPDSFGEGEDVEMNNIVRIYVKDIEITDPQLIFQGYISSYAPFYEGDNEGVSVTILTFGDTLKDFILVEDEVADQSQATGASTELFGGTKSIAQSFIPTVNTLTSVDIKFSVLQPTLVTLEVQTNGLGNEPSGTVVLNGSVSLSSSNTLAQVNRFTFTTPVDLTIGETYWLVLSS